MFDLISNIICVSSCKGGVGKSTFAVNLAFEISESNCKVGIVDLDIYGPSFGTLLPLNKSKIPGLIKAKQVGNDGTTKLVPVYYNNVAIMSTAFLLNDNQFLGYRGPMAEALAMELITRTDWGELDYLIVDLPPGTGDVNITVIENLPVTAVIIISTPSLLAFEDVKRGVEFFEKHNVNIIAIIENMTLGQGKLLILLNNKAIEE
ncbi:iron-sulfur cluster carrier protein-like [Dermatophagoides farinae]|uniref:iron-sulfur cluster carrier protein-like n=1 Tax=Dermatophagoides farinae TaxID=6954 RepID=UPI003F5DFDC3